MRLRDYRLTEEVARQTVEVAFKNHCDWMIAFSNPTAGPWKTIKLPGVDGRPEVVGTYLREDTRPDLALYSEGAGLLVLIEAKKSVNEMLNAAQMSKSIAMFGREIARFRGFGFACGTKPDIVTGFLYPTDNGDNDLERLRGAYATAVADTGANIGAHGSYVTFLITRAANGDLTVSWFYPSAGSADDLRVTAKLSSYLPPGFSRHMGGSNDS